MLDREMWEPMIQKLQMRVDTFPYCAERELMRFYLEELKYRCWHQTKGILPRWCYATDIDFIEWISSYDGEIIPCALVEIKSTKSKADNRRKNWQLDIIKLLSSKLELPAYLLTFNPEFSQFELEQLYPKQTHETLSSEQFCYFQKKLRWDKLGVKY